MRCVLLSYRFPAGRWQSSISDADGLWKGQESREMSKRQEKKKIRYEGNKTVGVDARTYKPFLLLFSEALGSIQTLWTNKLALQRGVSISVPLDLVPLPCAVRPHGRRRIPVFFFTFRQKNVEGFLIFLFLFIIFFFNFFYTHSLFRGV